MNLVPGPRGGTGRPGTEGATGVRETGEPRSGRPKEDRESIRSTQGRSPGKRSFGGEGLDMSTEEKDHTQSRVYTDEMSGRGRWYDSWGGYAGQGEVTRKDKSEKCCV